MRLKKLGRMMLASAALMASIAASSAFCTWSGTTCCSSSGCFTGCANNTGEPQSILNGLASLMCDALEP